MRQIWFSTQNLFSWGPPWSIGIFQVKIKTSKHILFSKTFQNFNSFINLNLCLYKVGNKTFGKEMLFPITVKADHHPVAGGMPFFYGRTNFI